MCKHLVAACIIERVELPGLTHKRSMRTVRRRLQQKPTLTEEENTPPSTPSRLSPIPISPEPDATVNMSPVPPVEPNAPPKAKRGRPPLAQPALVHSDIPKPKKRGPKPKLKQVAAASEQEPGPSTKKPGPKPKQLVQKAQAKGKQKVQEQDTVKQKRGPKPKNAKPTTVEEAKALAKGKRTQRMKNFFFYKIR